MSLATVNSLYPVYVYEEGMDLPPEGTYFVVAGNGNWLRKDMGILRSWVRVDNVSLLRDLEVAAVAEWAAPKVPERIVWRVKTFFRRVVGLYRAEAAVNLFFNKATQDFKVHIPEQRVSHAGVVYLRAAMTHVEGMQDYLRVGTIHSHSDFNAFHSGTDVGDEEDFDGLHVTFGNNDCREFTISASVVCNGHRCVVDPAAVLEGVEPVTPEKSFRLATDEFAPCDWSEGLDEWLGQVQSGTGPMAVREGMRVKWHDGRTPSSAVRQALGDGPFRVEDVEDGKLVIRAPFGLAKLPESLFKAV